MLQSTATMHGVTTRWSRHAWAAIFILPAALIYGAFIFYPLVATVVWGFLEWNGTSAVSFAGFGNFRTLFTLYPFNTQLFSAVLHNIVFFLLSIIVQLLFGLILAVLLRARAKSRVFLQAIYTLPFMMSPIIVGYLWNLILNPIFGPVYEALHATGLGNLYAPWLGQSSTALVTLSLISSWQSIGLPMLLFYAALSTIPSEIYEAAKMDGCTGLQTFRWIILPLVAPTAAVLTLLTFVASFNLFDLPYAVGGVNGAPNGALDVAGLLFYRLAFTGTGNGLGVGSAMATMIGLILLAFTTALLWYRRLAERWV
ncbi:MAG: sugar ABC transporter permease [Nakamurella sp.]